MTTYPLTTLAVTMTDAGPVAPSFADIVASLKASAAGIYGSDVYLENDSQDGQMLAVIASAINDCNNAALKIYNSFSPSLASGNALASNVKLNGIQKITATYSTVSQTIVGTVGTVISNAYVIDENNYKWTLPATVTIPSSGTIDVTATCTTAGAIVALSGTVTTIGTPTRGWLSTTNANAATTGTAVEADASLRTRQTKSTSLPAQSILAAITASVANLDGVTQTKPYENDTNATDSNGLPAHTISFVVAGGDDMAVASAIALKKTPGTGTYGTTSETVIDSKGNSKLIKFYRPTQVPFTVQISLTALSGYVSTTGAAVQAAVAAAISSLGIHANNGLVSYTALYAACYSVDLSNTFNVTLVKIARDAGTPAAADVTVSIYEQPTCLASSVTLTVS